MGHPDVGDGRATQSFVGTLSSTWRRPGLTLREVGWRWAYGAPAAGLIWWETRKALLAATGGTLDPARVGLDKALLNDPVGALSAGPVEAAGRFGVAIGLVLPYVARVGVWLVPLLLAGWVVASSLGRTAVLRRADGRMHARVGTVMVLQAIRVVALAAVCGFWYWGMVGDAGYAVGGPIAQGQEPNLILYCALAIVLTLGLFTAWAFASWVFGVAPLLAMLEDLGPRASLRAALRLGPVRGRLIEVNLVLGVVKIALIVLAMVFSATPLPFESVTTPEFLAWWWAGVTLVYLLWSDFFHVARLVGYLAIWRGDHDAER